jgi:hypothetical protein
MKKFTLLLSSIFLAIPGFSQNCSDLFISEYVEGSRYNKSIEIYNPTPSAITLTDAYRIIRWSNGSTVADTDPLYVAPLSGTIEPYQVMVIIQDTNRPGQDTMIFENLRKRATFTVFSEYESGVAGCKVVHWNGDDAVSLQRFINDQWTDIDIFGEIGVRPLNPSGGTSNPAGAWTNVAPYWRGQGVYLTQYKTLIRKPGIKTGIDRVRMNEYGSHSTGGYPDSFNALVEFDSLRGNFFDSLGFHTCDCKPMGVTTLHDNGSVRVYPNPANGEALTVYSIEPLITIELISVTGQRVLIREVSAGAKEITIPVIDKLREGIFVLKATDKKKQVYITKVVIQ